MSDLLRAHFDGKRFSTPGAPPIATLGMLLRWQFFSKRKKSPWPRHVPLPPAPPPGTPEHALSLTWINHSTFLLRTPAGNLLTDPVFSRRISPAPRFLGPHRIHPPAIPLHALPPISAILLSHDHYDHCDLPTLRHLARHHAPLGITAPGNALLLQRAGFTRTLELDWWRQTTLLPGFTLTATPAQHWSNRLTGRRCARLWAGFYLSHAGHRLYFCGDTGYHPRIFHQIREHLGPPHTALLPIGAYEPHWFMRAQHCNPAEAVQIHRDLNARQSIAMHWGCFPLADEAHDAPPRALAAALHAAGLPRESFLTLTPGHPHPLTTPAWHPHNCKTDTPAPPPPHTTPSTTPPPPPSPA